MTAFPSQWSDRPERKAVIDQIVRAALRAVDPAEAVHRVLQRTGDVLSVNGRPYDLRRYRRVLVVGAGKASAVMAQAVEEILGQRITAGVVAVKEGHGALTRFTKIVESSHPIPDSTSVAAAERVAGLVSEANADDLIICLLSGGASALIALPASGLTLEDKRQLTDALLRAGATINEMNAVRKHLSAIKGGGIVRLASSATVISLILSDVVGNPLDVIASGPTVPDTSTFQDAADVLSKYGLLETSPPAVRRRIKEGIDGRIAETLKPGDPLFARTQAAIIGSNEIAAQAALAAAEGKGFHTLLLSTFVEGEAREVGRVLAAIAKELAARNRPVPRPAFVIAGGETTVTVRGNGRGGRNQELALAAALQLAGWQDVVVASVATDGTDGQTDAAGAFADGETTSRARVQGKDPTGALSNNDSYSLFESLGDLLITGPTRTNVNDLMFVLAF